MKSKEMQQNQRRGNASDRSHSWPWRPRNWILTPSLLGLLAGAQLAHAQSQWTTTDRFQLVQGFSSAGVALSTNAIGNIIAVGYGVTGASGTTVGVTRQSQDLGRTWQTIGTLSFSGATPCDFHAVANCGLTNYAGGSFDAGGVANWFVTQSADGGDTWQVSDSFAEGVCQALAVDGSGNLFATGNTISNGYVYLAVRKLAAGGSGWSTVYQASVPSGSCVGIAVHPTAGVFVIGTLPYGSTTAWAVLRSHDGGNTWAVVDLVPSAYLSGSFGRGIAVDPQGNVYATGGVGNSWITRRSADGGTTWNTIDTFQYSAKGKSEGASVGFDYQGNVYVAGYGGGGKQGYYWIVRKFPAGSGPWQNSDTFQVVAGDGAYPYSTQGSILSANGGHVLLVTGRASDSSSDHWITRRLVVP